VTNSFSVLKVDTLRNAPIDKPTKPTAPAKGNRPPQTKAAKKKNTKAARAHAVCELSAKSDPCAEATGQSTWPHILHHGSVLTLSLGSVKAG
jgi:hypothetical protein